MRGYLLDESVPARLTFSPGLPLVAFSVAGKKPSDSEIWEFARLHELVCWRSLTACPLALFQLLQSHGPIKEPW